MQYQLKSLTPPQIARLDEVPITKQEQIIEKTGEPLKLLTAFYLVKNASADFTVQHEAAEKLDASMHTLLLRKGFFDGTMKTAARPEPVLAESTIEKPAQKDIYDVILAINNEATKLGITRNVGDLFVAKDQEKWNSEILSGRIPTEKAISLVEFAVKQGYLDGASAQSFGKHLTPAPDPNNQSPFGPNVHFVTIAKHDPAPEPNVKKQFLISNYPLAKKFMPAHQQQVVKSYGEEREAIFEEVEKMLAGIPKLRSQSKKELMEKTVFAHYFYGQSDWFILEYSSSDDMFYGYVILNGDSQMAESGYIGRRDLTESNRVELDFYWKPVMLGEALHKADPAYFPAPGKKEKGFTTEDLIGVGFDQKSKYEPAIWNKAKAVMDWLVQNTPFVEPYDYGPGKGKYTTTMEVSWAYLAELYDKKIQVPAPKFKPTDTAIYKGQFVHIKKSRSFDTVSKTWVYLVESSEWGDSGPDNVSEEYLSPINSEMSWENFVVGKKYKHANGEAYELDGLIKLGDGSHIPAWKKDGNASNPPPGNIPGLFMPLKDDEAKSKRLRIAQAKAKAQAARIRILKLKSQKAA